MDTVRIAFARFWPEFNPHENLFMNLLSRHFRVVLDDRPEFVVYSVFQGPLPDHPCTRIFWTGENHRADFTQCDWAFTSEYDEDRNHPRHLRLPEYLHNLLRDGHDPQVLVKRDIDVARARRDKTKFCNFLYWNRVPLREEFFAKLSRYKRVDAPGRSMNNMLPLGEKTLWEKCVARFRPKPLARRSRFSPGKEKWSLEKCSFLQPYKFTIAFENTSSPGYTTEKLTHPMLSGSIPIYWGNPLVGREFNTKSFINCHEYESFDEVVERVIQIDNDDQLYEQYLREPWYHDNVPSRYVNVARLEERIRHIFQADSQGLPSPSLRRAA